jgi:hypothetical protein
MYNIYTFIHVYHTNIYIYTYSIQCPTGTGFCQTWAVAENSTRSANSRSELQQRAEDQKIYIQQLYNTIHTYTYTYTHIYIYLLYIYNYIMYCIYGLLWILNIDTICKSHESSKRRPHQLSDLHW